jgi:hypothetical protein
MASPAERRQADAFLADLFGAAPMRAAEYYEDAEGDPTFPPRYSDVSGTEFIKTIQSDKTPADWQAREDAMVSQLLAGNLPEWLQKWITIRVSKNDATPEVTVRVLPDYLCVGNDTDYRHVPLDPQSAQRVADSYGAMLPTAKICHAIWRRTPWSHAVRAIQLPELQKKANQKFAQDSTAAFDAHSLAIQAFMKDKGMSRGELVAGHKKDVVLAVAGKYNPKTISFHGFYFGENPAEPCLEGGGLRPNCNKELPAVSAHPEGWGHFSDYSQGVRLIHPQMTIDGSIHLVADVLKDKKLSTLIAEGPIDPPRVPPAPRKR